jgi:multiple sugar transport system substrate-binding protein
MRPLAGKQSARPLASQRHLWASALLGLFLVAFLAACGAAGPQASPTPGVAAPGGPLPTVTVPVELPVVVSIAGRFENAELDLLQEQIAGFESANPDIRVEIVSERRSDAIRRQALLDHLAAGDASRDILLLHPAWLAEFDHAGWLRPLDAYARAERVALTGFFPAAIQASTLDGRLVALPWVVDGGLLYYRRDLLEAYGHDPPATWVDLQDIALEIQARESLPSGFVWQGAAYETLTCTTLEFVWASGGDVLDSAGAPIFDSPATRAGLQQMAGLIALGASPPEVAAYQETATLDVFEGGNAVFMRNWAYAWDRLQASDVALAGQVGLAPLPASCLGGEVMALSAHSLYPEQAFRFMAFLVGYEQQMDMARRGVQPPALETIYSDGALLAETPVFGALHAALSATKPRPQSAAYLELSEAIYSEVNRLLRGEQDAATAAAEVQRRLTALPLPSP